MKKYFAIACIVFSASSVFFFARAQGPALQDPLERELELSAQKYKTAMRNIGLVFDAQYERVIAENKAKYKEGEFGRFSKKDLEDMKESMDAAKTAIQIVTAREFGKLCDSLGSDIARCRLDGDIKETITQLAIMHAQAAAARGAVEVDGITNFAKAYLTRVIANNNAAEAMKALSTANKGVVGGQRILDNQLRNGELQIQYVGWLVGSPFNFFGIGRERLSAGQQALLTGRGIEGRINFIRQNIEGLQFLLNNAKAAIVAGNLNEEKLKDFQRRAQGFASVIRQQGQEIIDIVNAGINDKGAIKIALGGDVRALQDAVSQAEQHLAFIDKALTQLNSKEVQEQLKALAEASKVRIDITKPLRDNFPQLQQGRPGPVSTPDNPVVMERPTMLPPTPAPKPMPAGMPQGSPIQVKVIRGGVMTTETINSADPRYRILNTQRIDGLPVYEQFRP